MFHCWCFVWRKLKLKYSAPAVFQTTRVENETETAKWPGKAQDLDDFKVIPEVRLLFKDVVSFFLKELLHLLFGQWPLQN